MTDKTFKDYILTASRQYDYTLKFAFPLTEENIGTIERVSQKYGLVNITVPKKLPIQRNPLDFKNVENAEVFIVTILTNYPAPTEIFHQELRQALGVAEKLVVVRTKNDPYELEADKINAIRDEEKDGTYKVRLLSPHYEESPNTDVADALFGNDQLEVIKDRITDFRKEERKRIAGSNTGEAENFNAYLKSVKTKKSPFTQVDRFDGSIVD